MRYFCLIAYALILMFCISLRSGCKADDSPGFFLKITKNVPRLGRRSDKNYEHSFFNYKSIPRIGRSLENKNDFATFSSWLNEAATKKLNKRVLMTPTRLSSEHELSMVQPVNANTLIELLDKDAIPSDNVKFVHWKDFDRALQLDMDLYSKVISLGRRPDQRLKQDLTIGSYVPLFGSGKDYDDTEFVLYNHSGDLEGPYNSDLLRYNQI